MSPRLLKLAPILLLGTSWLVLIAAYFLLAAYSKANWMFAVLALVSVVIAMIAVLQTQAASSRLFYTSLASMLLLILFLISPFLKPLSPIRQLGQTIAGTLSQMVIGISPQDWAYPVKTAEEWITLSSSADTLSFKIFPNIPDWTHVCIFPGYSTDAQFIAVTKLKLPWKLSDKSKATTKKEYSAIAFMDEKTQNIVHVQDIINTQWIFAPKLYRTCLKRSKSQLKRQAEGTTEHGPTFGK